MTRTTRPDPIAVSELDRIAEHVPAVLGAGVAETFERALYRELKVRNAARSAATAHALDQFEANFRDAIREPLRSFVAALVEAGVLDQDPPVLLVRHDATAEGLRESQPVQS